MVINDEERRSARARTAAGLRRARLLRWTGGFSLAVAAGACDEQPAGFEDAPYESRALCSPDPHADDPAEHEIENPAYTPDVCHMLTSTNFSDGACAVHAGNNTAVINCDHGACTAEIYCYTLQGLPNGGGRICANAAAPYGARTVGTRMEARISTGIGDRIFLNCSVYDAAGNLTDMDWESC